MSEAKSSKKGGNPYGRRNAQMSNVAVEGDLCLYSGHSLGRFSSRSMRYDSHQACTRCVAAAREGRMSLSIDSLLKKYQEKALKFWSQVDIGLPHECWEWRGCINPKTKQPQFSWRRPGISTSTQHHPQRVAMWFSWGDLGYTGVKTTCGNKYCCNPFHIIPQNVGVFVDDDSYIDSFDYACQLHTLTQQVQEYIIEQEIKEQQQLDQSHIIDERASLMLDPNTDFNKRLEAAMTDMFEGRHISQLNLTDKGLYRDLSDDDDKNSTTDF